MNNESNDSEGLPFSGSLVVTVPELGGLPFSAMILCLSPIGSRVIGIIGPSLTMLSLMDGILLFDAKNDRGTAKKGFKIKNQNNIP